MQLRIKYEITTDLPFGKGSMFYVLRVGLLHRIHCLGAWVGPGDGV